jgi:NAD(P)-dependent dehydrogenase (short-subunit alcohol dehydrogenase family)
MKARVAWVTGGSRGIGLAVSRMLLENGYKVAVSFHQNSKSAESLVAQYPKALAIKSDLSDKSLILEAYQKITESFGIIDTVVNNAGISQIKEFEDLTDADWETMFSINFFAAVRITKLVIPGMKSLGFGRIVNIASIGGQWGGMNQVHYAASKAALINFTRSMAKLYSESGVCTNAIAPGLIETDMIKSEVNLRGRDQLILGIPAKKIGTAFDVASVVRFLCSNEASYISGQTINVNGGMYFV